MNQYEYNIDSDDDDLLAVYLDQSQAKNDKQEEVDFNVTASTSKESKSEENKGTSIELLQKENIKSFYDFLVDYTSLIVDRVKFKASYFNVEVNESHIKRRNNLTAWKSSYIDVHPLSILQQGKAHINTAVPLSILLLGTVGAVRTRDLKEKRSMNCSKKAADMGMHHHTICWCRATLPAQQFKHIEGLLIG